jgi:hypothetical protein
VSPTSTDVGYETVSFPDREIVTVDAADCADTVKMFTEKNVSEAKAARNKINTIDALCMRSGFGGANLFVSLLC